MNAHASSPDARYDHDDYDRTAVTGVVLAGGRARRMGGEDKGLVVLDGRRMVEYVLDALRPQVAAVLVNANRNQEAYARLTGCRVLADSMEGFAGPLAGMASALAVIDTEYLVTAPCDAPLVTGDLAPRLHAALVARHAEIAVAHDGERLQPVFALLRRGVLAGMLDYLRAGERKIDRWYATRLMATADFSDATDMFHNINTPQEHADLEARLRGVTTC